jgi:hypothetical protein
MYQVSLHCTGRSQQVLEALGAGAGLADSRLGAAVGLQQTTGLLIRVSVNFVPAKAGDILHLGTITMRQVHLRGRSISTPV